MAGGAAAALAPALAGPVLAQPGPVVWTFSRPDKVGGLATEVLGEPRPVAGPGGRALAFDGVDDGLVVPSHPLAGASAFTIEAVFRPDGGKFEQRWLHLAQDAADEGVLGGVRGGVPGGVSGGARMLFEVRVVEDAWGLVATVTGSGYDRTLTNPETRHPVGRWAHVAQVCDGRTYACFVDGVLQAQAQVAFRPQGPGRTSVGVRMNRVDWFKGAVREARFTRRALTPAEFKRPAGLVG